MSNTRLEKISPQKARKYLEKQARNRPVIDSWVRTIAAAIKAGEWKVNGETIKFNDLGELEDGQHRLGAIILADCGIETYVTRGLPHNHGIFETIDIGKKRTGGAILARRGEGNYNLLAGALSWLWKYDRGYWGTRHHATPRPQELTATLEAHPGIRQSLRYGQHAKRIMSPSAATCLHYLFSRMDAQQANIFFDFLATGENISRSSQYTSGIFHLRARLLENRSAKAQLKPFDVVALVIKAWNAMRSQQVIRALRWRTDGDKPEPFPTIC